MLEPLGEGAPERRLGNTTASFVSKVPTPSQVSKVDEIVMDGSRVTGIRGHDDGGKPVSETARIVIGV